MVKSSVSGFFYGKSSTLEGVLWENHQTNWWTNWWISMISIDVHFSSFSLWFFTSIPWFRIRRFGPPWGPLGSPPAAARARSRCGPGRPRPGWKRSGRRCYAPCRRRSRAPGDRERSPRSPRGENEKTTGRPKRGSMGFDDVGKMSLFRIGIGIILNSMGVMRDYHGKDAGINGDTFASIQFSHNLPKDQKGSKSESKLMMNYLSFFLDGTIYIHYMYIYI